ncbi:GNAT family N-acetyltransferase [Sphingobacterium griseoflavum]|uniref:N-acetyltransferase n=1 Tax=Sphingobacterium griseoflavum TaxID=1474952 RepID=A0ABQ3HX26_9SPHI|nr:GNAT family N-acetyltransferase [Sphingobacterium griseoflavum]GHE29315.1 N-acetyltransferase [Sphingobacterium griseoflavum]
MEIVQAGQEAISVIENLAQRSWRAGYAGVLSSNQIEFMLDKMYSPTGLLEAMHDGCIFYLALANGNPVGFIGLKTKSSAVLRIEKIYLLPEVQGKGYGKRLINFAMKQAARADIPFVQLNVNRKNKAYYFYLKQGFTVVAEVDIPYYGYILDDYVMQKPL